MLLLERPQAQLPNQLLTSVTCLPSQVPCLRDVPRKPERTVHRFVLALTSLLLCHVLVQPRSPNGHVSLHGQLPKLTVSIFAAHQLFTDRLYPDPQAFLLRRQVSWRLTRSGTSLQAQSLQLRRKPTPDPTHSLRPLYSLRKREHEMLGLRSCQPTFLQHAHPPISK